MVGRGSRVQEVLDSKEFCSELESLIKQEIEHQKMVKKTTRDNNASHVASPSLPPISNVGSVCLGLKRSLIMPIADWDQGSAVGQNERTLRNKLAALYRLVDLFQWSQGIYNHITVRIDETGGSPPEILINPFGLLYHEITASSLVKISVDGRILDSGLLKMGINQAGYVLHSAIHEARPDVKCIIHLHTPVVAAVSSMKCGLLPICQEAMIIGPVAYHDYHGIVSAVEEKESLVKDLGDMNVMLLRNHGFVVCGESIEDALHLAFHMIIACQTQIRCIRAGLNNITVPDKAAVQRAYEVARSAGGGGVNRVAGSTDGSNKETICWRIGELEWEAWMRALDAAANEMNAQAFREQRLVHLRKEQEKSRWLNSPNCYQKVEVLETMTDQPRVITKWVSKGCSNRAGGGTPTKINAVHQFTPFGTNPKEFKLKQRALKENRSAGAMSSGPRSQVLDAPGHEISESKSAGHSPNDRTLVIGTASKGIIARDQQHNAQVYRQVFLPNPFMNETDDEIKEYMMGVHENCLRPSMSQDGDLQQSCTSKKQMSASTPTLEKVLPPFERRSDGRPPLPTVFKHRPGVVNEVENNGIGSNGKEQRLPRSKSIEAGHDSSIRGHNTQIVWDSEMSASATLPSSGKVKKKSRGLFSFARKKK